MCIRDSASTDPERMKAFFESELERRAYTEEDIEDAQGQFDALFGRMFTEVFDCIDPYEGVVDGTLLWNGGAARQIYILEEGAQTPGFPPNLHLPEGTVWALFVDPATGSPIEPGTLTPGEIPEGTFQAWPDDGSAPVFEEGTTYRFFAASDVMSSTEASCTITWTTGG